MTRYIVAIVAVVIGLWLIYVGRSNVQTQTAEETGVRRRVNTALGESNTYTGGRAMLQGWLRIGMGVVAIAFGIGFAFLGPDG